MSLEKYRMILLDRLRLGTAFKASNVPLTLKAMENWWTFYKAWEGQDTFLKAFREGRMTVRQIPIPKYEPGAEIDWEDENSIEKAKYQNRPVNQIKPFDVTYGNYNGKASETTFGAWRGRQEGVPYERERYRVGTIALKDRMNPAKFGIDGGERLKYKHGLHDLSVSLCVPTIPALDKQVRWKWGELAVRITVFMPLGKEEDMYLFFLLNAAAKKERAASPQAYEEVAYMRRRMTRIKLADSVDIGAGLRDVSSPGSDVPKFRYGVKEDLVNGQLTGIDRERQQKALAYTSILPKTAKPSNIDTSPTTPMGRSMPKPVANKGATTSCNEIVVAYREHEGDRFPIFTKFDNGAFVCHPDEASSRYIVGGVIPNNWERTVEL
ncbi:MAG: hypothetical protein ACRD3N_11725 [Terracidiphilus sp.]